MKRLLPIAIAISLVAVPSVARAAAERAFEADLPDGKGTLVVVALVKGSEKGHDARERGIARVAKAAFDAFGR